MVLSANSNAGFHNESKGCSQIGSHIFLAESKPFPPWNGLLLTIAQVIKYVISSAAEAELGELFITAKELVPIRHTLIEMGFSHPLTPIQPDNSTAAGVVNDTFIAQKTKSMDLRLHWLRCRKAQQKI